MRKLFNAGKNNLLLQIGQRYLNINITYYFNVTTIEACSFSGRFHNTLLLNYFATELRRREDI